MFGVVKIYKIVDKNISILPQAPKGDVWDR
jgi:hypothetical protein